MQSKPTLCWKCAHACGGCSWSDSLTPVEGWIAKPSTIKVIRGGEHRVIEADTFLIIKCPEFVDDTDQYNKRPRWSGKNDYEPNPIARMISNREFAEVSMRKCNARKEIEALPEDELRRRIERLSGVEKDVAMLVFVGKLRGVDAARILHYNEGHMTSDIIPKVARKIVAMK